MFSKEQYLQSNCQFIVDGGDDYSANLVDPDIQVDWEKIQVITSYLYYYILIHVIYLSSLNLSIFIHLSILSRRRYLYISNCEPTSSCICLSIYLSMCQSVCLSF